MKTTQFPQTVMRKKQ